MPATLESMSRLNAEELRVLVGDLIAQVAQREQMISHQNKAIAGKDSPVRQLAVQKPRLLQ